MNKGVSVVLVFFLLTAVAVETIIAQKEKKSWKEWTKKDAEKILNNSAWGQLQIDTDLSEMFFQP